MRVILQYVKPGLFIEHRPGRRNEHHFPEMKTKKATSTEILSRAAEIRRTESGISVVEFTDEEPMSDDSLEERTYTLAADIEAALSSWEDEVDDNRDCHENFVKAVRTALAKFSN